MIDYWKSKQWGWPLLFVHDEILISVPPEHAIDEARLLIDTMIHALDLSVPMRAEAKMGSNFAEMKKLEVA